MAIEICAIFVSARAEARFTGNVCRGENPSILPSLIIAAMGIIFSVGITIKAFRVRSRVSAASILLSTVCISLGISAIGIVALQFCF